MAWRLRAVSPAQPMLARGKGWVGKAYGLGATDGRVRVDGKFLALNGQRFTARGVTYGTFAPRLDGALFPETEQIRVDLTAIKVSGFNVVRTYTAPPADFLSIAAAHDIRVIAGIFYPDWRYLVGNGRRGRFRVASEAAAQVRTDVRRLSGRPEVLAVCIGNEVPADAIRWVGHKNVAAVLDGLVDLAHEIDPEMLVTYGQYPTSEYMTLDRTDIVMFNVFLERREDFRRYLNRLHNLAGDRPLLLGEIGCHVDNSAGSEEAQAVRIEEQIRVALERGAAGTCVFAWTDEWHVGGSRVEGWRFGLTRADRSPRPALARVAAAQAMSVAELDWPWPSLSVVVCAWNSAATLDECLDHVCALDYPDLEVLVIDDGSTDSTAEIPARHKRARVVSIPHGGLSVARNTGISLAKGELIAFVDSDAYPSPEWPYYLALGMDRSNVVGVGGPNLPPASDPPKAQAVVRAPGGPSHVLLTDDRAEHIPGCNMAFWRQALVEVGGFDPIYTTAGDDVDLCWRLLDRGNAIAYHPAALVWHHRRGGRRSYLRQQRGYGRAETLVAARHPDRFTGLGGARWRGALYNGFPPLLAGQPIYRGRFGTATFQSIYRGPSHNLDVVHQAGIPTAVALVPLSLSPLLAIRLVGLVAIALMTTLFVIDAAVARPPRSSSGLNLRLRVEVAALHLLQPLARLLGRLGSADEAARVAPTTPWIAAGAVTRNGGTVMISTPASREEIMVGLIRRLRDERLSVIASTGWEEHDFRVHASTLVACDVISTSHLAGVVQIRVRTRLRAAPVAAFAVLAGIAALATPAAVLVVLLAAGVELARGERCGRSVIPAHIVRAVSVQRSGPTRVQRRSVSHQKPLT
jgi:glycosyltransferase involved in cell wall biosynthesis